MIPARFQSRPVEPTQVEAVLLTEDNLQDVAAWLNRFSAYNLPAPTEHAWVDTSPASGKVSLLVPASWGVHRLSPGEWLVHVGNGDVAGMTATAFAAMFEPRPPDPPGLCSCLTPLTVASSGDSGETWTWSPCNICGRDLSSDVARRLSSADPLISGSALP